MLRSLKQLSLSPPQMAHRTPLTHFFSNHPIRIYSRDTLPLVFTTVEKCMIFFFINIIIISLLFLLVTFVISFKLKVEMLLNQQVFTSVNKGVGAP